MRIILKTINQEQYTVDVDINITVSELKQHIEEKYQIPQKYQTLIFSGKILDNVKTLSEYGIQEDSFLVLMNKSPGQTKPPSPSGIQWDEHNQTGRKYNASGGYSIVYSAKYGFQQYLLFLLNILVHDPKNFQRNQIVVKTRNLPLFHIHNTNAVGQILLHKETIYTRLITEFRKYLERTSDTPNCTDFEFLARLSLKRRWDHECMLCLDDKHMGQTCDCGHKDIVIFRPCGHSMCLKTCFIEFMENKGHIFTGKQIASDGKVYTVVGKPECDLCVNFDCPVCQSKVTHTFNSSDTYMHTTYDSFIEDLAINLRMELDLSHYFYH